MPNNGPPHERVPSMAVDDEQSESAMTDPVSWLQIEQGWNVITSDGVIVGTVAQVEGDKQSDIFDGLAVESKQPTQIRYVPGEQVAAIYPGEVTLKIASAGIGALEPFQAPPETKWLPGKVPLMTRISNSLRGRR
jgi:sporulation protein YlmC with PRC-barrel domain